MLEHAMQGVRTSENRGQIVQFPRRTRDRRDERRSSEVRAARRHTSGTRSDREDARVPDRRRRADLEPYPHLVRNLRYPRTLPRSRRGPQHVLLPLSSARPAVVHHDARRADARAGARLDVDRRGPAHAHRRADRIGQDARGVSLGNRRADARGARVAAAGRSARRLRLAAEGAERRHPQEPRGAAPRHSPARGGGGAAGAAHHGRGPHRRHLAVRARGDAAHAAAHPGDDAGVALPAADVRAQPRRCCAPSAP